MATALQLVGLLVLCAGLFVWFGTGPGLVGSGVAAAIAGTALELDKRRG